MATQHPTAHLFPIGQPYGLIEGGGNLTRLVLRLAVKGFRYLASLILLLIGVIASSIGRAGIATSRICTHFLSLCPTQDDRAKHDHVGSIKEFHKGCLEIFWISQLNWPFFTHTQLFQLKYHPSEGTEEKRAPLRATFSAEDHIDTPLSSQKRSRDAFGKPKWAGGRFHSSRSATHISESIKPTQNIHAHGRGDFDAAEAADPRRTKKLSTPTLRRRHDDLNRGTQEICGQYYCRPFQKPRSSSAHGVRDGNQPQTPPETPRRSIQAPPGGVLSVEALPAARIETAAGTFCLHLKPQFESSRQLCFQRNCVTHQQEGVEYSLAIDGSLHNDRHTQNAQGLQPTNAWNPSVLEKQHCISRSFTTNGVVDAPGGPSNGKRKGTSVPLPLGIASAAATTGSNKTGSINPSSDGEVNSEDEHRAPDPNRVDKQPPDKRRRTLQYRCPKHAANPNACDPRCEDWHNADISAVTRHVLKDAQKDSSEYIEIKKLSHQKLSPDERWKRYFRIFSRGVVDQEEMNQPYWIKWANTDPTDRIGQLLKLAMARMTFDEKSSESLSLLQEYERLRRDMLKRIGRADLQYQKHLRILEKELEQEKTGIETQFDEDVALLMDRFERKQPLRIVEGQSSSAMAMQRFPRTNQDDFLLYTAGKSPGDRGSSLQEVNFEMDAGNGAGPSEFNLQLDPGRRTVQPEPPVFYDRAIPRPMNQNPLNGAQPLTDLFSRTDKVMKDQAQYTKGAQPQQVPQWQQKRAKEFQTHNHRARPSDSTFESVPTTDYITSTSTVAAGVEHTETTLPSSGTGEDPDACMSADWDPQWSRWVVDDP